MIDPKGTLYHRLGGHDVLAAFVEDLMSRLPQDPILKVYWKGKSRGSFAKEKQLLLEFLCAAFGGPATYTGRDMKASHEDLGITTAEYDLVMKYIGETLDRLSIRDPERAEFLAAAESLRGDIVEVA